MVSITIHAHKNFITVVPGDCANCTAAIELTENENNIYIFQEGFAIDSISYRKKFTFLKNASLIFSDSLFNLYSIDGRMTISNESGTLKCLLSKYNRTAHQYFILQNGAVIKY